ncbi:unnamed protein product, partial [Iphiclides podalirius]
MRADAQKSAADGGRAPAGKNTTARSRSLIEKGSRSTRLVRCVSANRGTLERNSDGQRVTGLRRGRGLYSGRVPARPHWPFIDTTTALRLDF